MAQSSSSDFKARLAGKRVIVKVSLLSRAFSGTVVDADETGFCLLSDDMVAALRESTGNLMSDMDNAGVYLPFAALQWLVFSQMKAAAASA